MLQSLRDVVDGWRQARTFRHLTEILADTSDGVDISGSAKPLTKEEMLGILAQADAFVRQYVRRIDEFAFSVGAITYGWLSPRYRREGPGLLAHIQYKTEHHIV